MSSSSQSKLTAKFQTPRLLSLGKRAHEEGTAGQAASDSKKRARRWEMAPPSDDEDDDDVACMPMSDSQLSKHSRVDLYSPELPLKEPDANKLLDAKVARLGMKNRAAEFKEMRNRPGTTFTHAAPPSSAVVSTLTKGDSHGGGTRFMLCLWRTPQTRKHKTWDGDACLIIKPGLTGNKLLDTNSRQW